MTTLSIALVAPLAVLALAAPRTHWAFVLRGPVGWFAAFMVLSILWSENPLRSAYIVGNWSIETLAAMAAVALGGAIANRYLAVLLKGFLVLSVLTAILLPALGRMNIPGTPWRGIFDHKNALGAVCAFAIVLFATTGRPGHRLRWVLFSGLVLLMSEYRTGLAAATTALLVIGLARVVYTRRPGRRPLPATVFYSLLALGAFLAWQLADVLLSLVGRDRISAAARTSGRSSWTMGASTVGSARGSVRRSTKARTSPTGSKWPPARCWTPTTATWSFTSGWGSSGSHSSRWRSARSSGPSSGAGGMRRRRPTRCCSPSAG